MAEYHILLHGFRLPTSAFMSYSNPLLGAPIAS